MQHAYEQLREASKQLVKVRRSAAGPLTSRLDVQRVADGLDVFLLIGEDVGVWPDGETFARICRLLGSPPVAPWLARVTLEGYLSGRAAVIDWHLEPIASAKEPFARLKVFRVEANGASDGYGCNGTLRGRDEEDTSVATRLLERMPVLEELTLPAPPGEESFFQGNPHPLRKLTIFDVDTNPLPRLLAESRKFPHLEEVRLSDSRRMYRRSPLSGSDCVEFLQSPYFPALRSVTLGRIDVASEAVRMLLGTRIARQVCRLSIEAQGRANRGSPSLPPNLPTEPFPIPVFDKQPWLTDTVKALAKGIHDSGDCTAIPILADALEEAGCDDLRILGHCRDSGKHFPGCWVVESILRARQIRSDRRG